MFQFRSRLLACKNFPTHKSYEEFCPRCFALEFYAPAEALVKSGPTPIQQVWMEPLRPGKQPCPGLRQGSIRRCRARVLAAKIVSE